MAGSDDLVDERRPVVRPLLFEDGNQDEVEFVQESALASKALFGFRIFEDEVDNEVSNA